MIGHAATLTWTVLAGILGLAVGSFLNVVIYRVPAGESVVRPPSHCPSCGNGIRTRHNVPVFGWLLLRGRCFDCAAPISARYPLVEALTGVLFAVVTLRLLDSDQRPAVVACLYLVAIGVALSAIDLDVRRLPDSIVLPSYAVVAVMLVGTSAYSHDWWALGRAGIGAVTLLVAFPALVMAYPGGMGLGDVKLAGVLGGVLGYLSWAALVVGAFAGFVLGALASVAIVVGGHGNRKTAIPFGPFMIAGALLAIFAARPIADAYLAATGRG